MGSWVLCVDGLMAFLVYKLMGLWVSAFLVVLNRWASTLMSWNTTGVNGFSWIYSQTELLLERCC